jgi:hypothetical protein
MMEREGPSPVTVDDALGGAALGDYRRRRPGSRCDPGHVEGA